MDQFKCWPFPIIVAGRAIGWPGFNWLIDPTFAGHRQRSPAQTFRVYDLQMIDWSSCSAVEQDSARVSGAWLFRGTRVPVAALFENLEDDATIHEFVDWFPGVTIAQARVVLEYAARSAMATA